MELNEKLLYSIPVDEQLYRMLIEDGIPYRVSKAVCDTLERLSMQSLGELCEMGKKRFKMQNGVGPRCINHLTIFFNEQFGLEWKD